MRYLLVIIALISLQFKGISQDDGPINWLTVEQADSLYKIAPKPMFIDVYTDWCGWCKRMDAGTFQDKYIADYLNKNFYPIKFNAESSEPLTFNGKTYENTQSLKAKSMLENINSEIALMKDTLKKYENTDEAAIKLSQSITKKQNEYNNLKARSRKTTHDFAMDVCRGQLSYPTFILLFDNLKANLPIKGYQQPNQLFSYLTFVREGTYRHTYDLGKYNELFQQVIKPDSAQMPNLINYLSLEEAISKAQKEPKKIIVHLYNKGSIVSNITDKIIYRTPSTAKILNENFYTVRFDIEDKKPITFADTVFQNLNGIHQMAYLLSQNQLDFPMHAFLNEKGQLIMKVPQYFEPGGLDPVLMYFLEDAYKTMTYGEWKASKQNAEPTTPTQSK